MGGWGCPLTIPQQTTTSLPPSFSHSRVRITGQGEHCTPLCSPFISHILHFAPFPTPHFHTITSYHLPFDLAQHNNNTQTHIHTLGTPSPPLFLLAPSTLEHTAQAQGTPACNSHNSALDLLTLHPLSSGTTKTMHARLLTQLSTPLASTSSMSSSLHSTHSSSNVVGVHYRVGKKIGEGSFGIIYEGKCSWPASTKEFSIRIRTFTPNPLDESVSGPTRCLELTPSSGLVYPIRYQHAEQSASGHQV